MFYNFYEINSTYQSTVFKKSVCSFIANLAPASSSQGTLNGSVMFHTQLNKHDSIDCIC